MNRTPSYGNRPLELAAIGLIVGAAIHVAAWAGGPPWMAALGAPPSIVASAAAGTWPALLGTLVIAAMLAGLACCCVMTSRRNGARYPSRAVLAATAVLFTARGLLVVPYALAGQRAWRTPIGRFVVTGQYFTAGSIVVLAIGLLIGIGLFRSRSKRHGIPTQAQPEVG